MKRNSGEHLKKIKRFFINGCILTLTGLWMRTVSMSFQIYLSERMGSVGMGLFTLILSVYGFATTVAHSGIQLATVRMVSVAQVKGSAEQLRSALSRCFLYCVCFGVGTALLLYLLAPWIGTAVLSDLRTVRPLRILALGLPLLPCTACINGYFHAVSRLTRHSLFQIAEQFLYMFLTVLLLRWGLPKGLEYACIAVLGASVLSDLISLLLHALSMWHDMRCHPLPKGSSGGRQGRLLLSIALPVAISSYARSALLTVEHILIPKGLRRHGSNSEQALASYGALHAMALPTVLFGQSFLVAFAALLIPQLAAAKEQGHSTQIARIVRRGLYATLPFAVGVSFFLIAFAQELGEVLYHQAQAAEYIRLLAPLVVVMYLDTVTDSMLKGLGEQMYSMRVNIADAAISVIGVALLLPRFGLGAYFVILYGCELFNTVHSLSRLLSVSTVKLPLLQMGLGLFFAAAGAMSVSNLIKNLFALQGWWAIALAGILFFACYLLFLRMLYSKRTRSWRTTVQQLVLS